MARLVARREDENDGRPPRADHLPETKTMKYMLLLYATQDGPREFSSPEEMKAMIEPWMKYTEDMKAAGVYLGGDALKGTDTATTLRVRDGDVTTTDGPFAATTETLGGYYMIDVPDLDEALKWAQRCPLANYGSVEVRPLEMFE